MASPLSRRVMVSTHSRPKAAGASIGAPKSVAKVSTHSRPKAAGSRPAMLRWLWMSFNTQPPEGGWEPTSYAEVVMDEFQHTAARRRLGLTIFAPRRCL